MASLKCMFCGNRIHHHGEPEGTEPVEHIFCTLENWEKLEEENMSCDHLELEHDGIFFYVWRCQRCNTFTFFNDDWNILEVYTPADKFTTEPINEPTEFGPFWDDFLWFDINETDDTPASEVLSKFPGNYWLEKNENEMRIYKDKEKTQCLQQFKRLIYKQPITVATMSLNSFKKMLVNYDDEIDFFYQNKSYEFIKTKVDSKIKIVINRDFDTHECIYTVTVENDENYIDDVINAKIFTDGKSIAEAQNDIRL